MEGLEGYVNNINLEDLDNGYSVEVSTSVAYNQEKRFLKNLRRQLQSQRINQQTHRDFGLREYVVHGSKLMDQPPAVQGPFLFQPTPHELEDSDYSDAVDFYYTCIGQSDPNLAESGGLCVMVIIYQDGKLDICLDIQKVTAKWSGSNSSSRLVPSEPPALFVYETVKISQNLAHCQLSYSPQLLKDPTTPYVFYVSHQGGAHCVSIERWVRSLATTMAIGFENVGQTVVNLGRSETVKIATCDEKCVPHLCGYAR